jgi:hypothetical protein
MRAVPKRGESPDYALAVARGNANHLEWETATVRVSREKKGDCLPEAVLEANDRLVAERYVVWSSNGAEALHDNICVAEPRAAAESCF